MEIKVKIKIKDVEIEVDQKDLKELYEFLDSMFGTRTPTWIPYVEPWYPTQPWYESPYWIPWPTPYDTGGGYWTNSSGTISATQIEVT